MNPAASQNAGGGTGRSTATTVLYAAVMLLVLTCAVSARSFWIDEAWTAHFARMPSLKMWWTQLAAARETNLQMPLYSLWIWGCEKVAGSSEFTLRFLNFCWFIPALVVAGRAFAGRRLAVAAFLTAALSPFAWYYLGEARSYTMQLSTALVVYAALVRLVQGPAADEAGERRWVLVFAVGMVLLCGSSLLAMFLATIPLLILAVLLPWARARALLRAHAGIWVVMTVVLTGWAVFYLWTLSHGARATAIAGTDWRNPLFVAYELSGFSGLGPGRSAIRGGGLGAFKEFAVLLPLYGLCAGVLVAGALAELRHWGGRKVLLLVAAVAVPVAVLLLASHLKHFRILGRHFAALFPVVWLLFAGGMVRLWCGCGRGRLMVGIFLVLSVGSALSVRFAARHEKDNYRAVAVLARAELARGGVVWWSADDKAAEYYSVPLAEAPGAPGARAVLNPVAAELAGLARPAVVICSRPDAFDVNEALAAWLVAEKFRVLTNVSGLVVWSPP